MHCIKEEQVQLLELVVDGIMADTADDLVAPPANAANYVALPLSPARGLFKDGNGSHNVAALVAEAKKLNDVLLSTKSSYQQEGEETQALGAMRRLATLFAAASPLALARAVAACAKGVAAWLEGRPADDVVLAALDAINAAAKAAASAPSPDGEDIRELVSSAAASLWISALVDAAARPGAQRKKHASAAACVAVAFAGRSTAEVLKLLAQTYSRDVVALSAHVPLQLTAELLFHATSFWDVVVLERSLCTLRECAQAVQAASAEVGIHDGSPLSCAASAAGAAQETLEAVFPYGSVSSSAGTSGLPFTSKLTFLSDVPRLPMAATASQAAAPPASAVPPPLPLEPRPLYEEPISSGRGEGDDTARIVKELAALDARLLAVRTRVSAAALARSPPRNERARSPPALVVEANVGPAAPAAAGPTSGGDDAPLLPLPPGAPAWAIERLGIDRATLLELYAK